MRDALFIARKDLKYMLKERETLLWTFVMPILFFYFIGTVTGGFGGGPMALGGEQLAVEGGERGGFLGAELRRRLEAEKFELVEAEGEEYAAHRRRLEVPADLTERALAGQVSTVHYRRRGESLGGDYEKVRVAKATYGVLADLAVLQEEGVEPTPASFEELRARPRALELRVQPAGERLAIPSGFDQAIPGIMVMFTMSILLSGGATMLVTGRTQGLLRRLASTPITRGSIVFGKWLAQMGLGLVQLAFGMIAGTVLFSMDWGPRPAAVMGLLVLWAAFNASLSLLMGNLVRSEAQAAGIGTLATMVLAALGGCWWPIEITPQWMQNLAMALPTGWAMDGMHRLVSFGQPVAAVALNGALLIAGALVAGWFAARRFRYQ